MIEQMLFEGVNEATKDGREVLEEVIVKASKQWNCSADHFRIEENKSKKMLTGYSLYFEKSLVLKSNIEFTVISCDINIFNVLSLKPTSTKELKIPQNFIQCSFATQLEAVASAEFIVDESIRVYEPSEHFGCCGLYEKCSDAKKCLHKDLIRSKSCYYKKNLESGKIFYGKNANI